MSRHRFLEMLQSDPAPAVATAVDASGFVMCPLALQGAAWPWQQQIYQLALEQARAVVRPSLLERWQRASAN